MSMLTPPGMGGKYKITGNAYPRMRPPRRRRFLAATAALVTMGVLGWGTLELVDIFTGRHEADAAEKPDCGPSAPAASGATGRTAQAGAARTPAPGAEGNRGAAPARDGLPEARSMTVNVYNATPRSGLAKKVSDELKKRGFKIGKVDNAPALYDKKVKETAVLVGGPQSEQSLRVLGAHLPGTRAARDARKDASVDLVIGAAFKELDPPRTAQKTLAALAKPSPVARAGSDCTP